MSSAVSKSLCTIHFERPATARCPSCRRFYCAECVTEHQGKLVCATCLGAAAVETKTRRSARFRLHPAAIFQIAAALVLVWSIFYALARFLGDIPDSFHDGTIWE